MRRLCRTLPTEAKLLKEETAKRMDIEILLALQSLRESLGSGFENAAATFSESAMMAGLVWAHLNGLDLEKSCMAGIAASSIAIQSEQTVNSYMNDTRLIRWHGEKFSADRFQLVHAECRDSIVSDLTNLRRMGVPSCKIVVVTHHCPSALCENPIHKGGRLTTAFIADDMQDIISEFSPAYWIYGHTHYNKDIDLCDTHIVSNQMGYNPKESKDFSFGKCFFI